MVSLHYNKKYFTERDHLDPYIASIIEILAKKNGIKSILDVGCGSGRLVKYLTEKGFTVFGIDPAPVAVKAAQKLCGKSKIKLASAEKMPFQRNTIDLITCISVIEHLHKKQTEKFLNECRRVLKPDGFIFFITPNYGNLISRIQGDKWFGYQDPTHISFFSPATLRLTLSQYGFANFRTRFEFDNSIKFDWHLPDFAQKLPSFMKQVLTFSMLSAPIISLQTNSFRMSARFSK
jgi:2-polyprenyl-3-methyl-5-hydroxy-6-metoxy-1,4-benzoquinol methylase